MYVHVYTHLHDVCVHLYVHVHVHDVCVHLYVHVCMCVCTVYMFMIVTNIIQFAHVPLLLFVEFSCPITIICTCRYTWARKNLR